MEKQIIVAAFNCPNCGAAIAPESPSCCYCGSAVATRVCPACFGAVSVGMKHCPHCGAVAADSRSEKPGDLRCPRCEVNLNPLSVGGHPLNSCSRCGGLWVGKDVFQKICTHEEEQEAVLGFQPEPAQSSASPDRKPRRAYIPCPECGKLMNHKNFSGCSGVVLDWCRGHGSWFDRSELQQIVMFIRNGGLHKAREREQLQLKEQEERIRMQEFNMSTLERRLGGSPESPHQDDPLLQLLGKLL
jgi:Zn-finger nucleic acid-binding protein